MNGTDMKKMTIPVKLSDLDILAHFIVEIDESKGNQRATQVLIDNAHKNIMRMLGEHVHLVYQAED